MNLRKHSIQLLALSVLILLSSPSSACCKAFDNDSLAKIQATYQQQPFLMVLWSTSCAPCRGELDLLNTLKRQHPDINLVLIATDNADQTAAVDLMLKEYNLTQSDNWLFANNNTERLKHAIDPDWFGEMPRSYFYDAKHTRKAISGKLTAKQIENWLLNTST